MNKWESIWRDFKPFNIVLIAGLIFCIALLVVKFPDEEPPKRAEPEEISETVSVDEEPKEEPLSAEEPEAEPEESCQEVNEPQSRYSTLTISQEDKELMAKVIYLEARGECFEGQQAVAEVILNRVMSSKFPNTVTDVVYQSGQFSVTPLISQTTATDTQYNAIDAALNGTSVLPEDVLFFSTEAITSSVWGSIGHHVFCY